MSEENSLSLGNDAKDIATLSQLFDKAFDLFNEINKTNEPTSSAKIQSDIRRAMSMLEDATKLVSIVDMFSHNESFEEVATENLKYFLLPAFLGTLATKICNTSDRMHVVNVAEIYFMDFLKRVKAYGLPHVLIPETDSDSEKEVPSRTTKSNSQLTAEVVFRRNRILQRYEERKELEASLVTLRKNMSNPNIDEEIKRQYFMTLIKLYVNLTMEELSSLAAEKPILEHIEKMGKTGTMASHASQKRKPAPKLQPIIITRNEAQKKVYGAGYPSLPILTVQEFYDQRVKEGDWPNPSQQIQANSKPSGGDEAEEIKKEKLLEDDDPEALNQLRAMDDYKDMHRRGWGNRANRS